MEWFETSGKLQAPATRRRLDLTSGAAARAEVHHPSQRAPRPIRIRAARCRPWRGRRRRSGMRARRGRRRRRRVERYAPADGGCRCEPPPRTRRGDPDAVARWAAASAASSGPDASDRCDRGVAWGTPDAFDIARIAVDRLPLDREALVVRRNIKRYRGASQKLAQASAKADDAERDGAMVVAARHKDAKKRHLDRVTELEKQLDAARRRLTTPRRRRPSGGDARDGDGHRTGAANGCCRRGSARADPDGGW